MSRVDVFREARERFVQLQRGDLALGGCEGVSANEKGEGSNTAYWRTGNDRRAI